MTRLVVVFEDGTAEVDGVEVDALGGREDLPFLSDGARLAAARRALAEGDGDAAQVTAERGVLTPSSEDHLYVTFVAPPDWDRFGEALWNNSTGRTHAVFTSKLMLMDGAAVMDCVGATFADDDDRRQCAMWCLRNGLDDIAGRVARTPVGGRGPHCTWPDLDLPKRAEPTVKASNPAPVSVEQPPEEVPDEPTPATPSNVVELFGGVFPRPIG